VKWDNQPLNQRIRLAPFPDAQNTHPSLGSNRKDTPEGPDSALGNAVLHKKHDFGHWHGKHTVNPPKFGDFQQGRPLASA
jgi:hypothetical protein